MKNHGTRQKSHIRRRSHKETGGATGQRQASTSGRNKKRCHSESSVTRPTVEIQIPETVGSADEEDNNYYDLYSGSFEDDEVFITSSQEVLKEENNSTINLNELSSCLDKIQNTEEETAAEVDYSNLFATVEVTNDVDIIDKLINDYDQDEFVPFEYVKKLMFDEPQTNAAMPVDEVDFHHSIDNFSYGML